MRGIESRVPEVSTMKKTVAQTVKGIIALVGLAFGSIFVFGFYLGVTGNSIAGSIMTAPLLYIVAISMWNTFLGDNNG